MTEETAVGRTQALKSLKQLSQSPIHMSDANTWGKVVHDESDRGAIILISGMIEEFLVSRINRKLIKLNSKETKEIYGADAPLGTFSAKIRMAYAMGLITRQVRNMIDVLRSIRNACAHTGIEISFSQKEMRDAIRVYISCIDQIDVTKLDFDLHSKAAVIYLTMATQFILRNRVGEDAATLGSEIALKLNEQISGLEAAVASDSVGADDRLSEA